MIVCHCKVIRADDIRTEVRLGASSLAEVAMRCGAATKCGGCIPAVEAVIADELRRADEGVAVSVRD